MQTNNKNIVWGVILLVLGFIFLGNNLDWFDITFRSVARFWPLMIILAGVNVILSKYGNGLRSLTPFLLAFAIPMAIFTSIHNKVDDVKDDIETNIIDDFEDDDNQNDNDSTSKQNYTVTMNAGVQEASLDFGSGAGKFKLEESTSNLFDAETELSKGSYMLTHDEKTNAIEFKMKSKIKIDSNDEEGFDFGNNFHNRVAMRLNTAPTWKLKFGVGAGGADLDLSAFKVKALDIEAGAAEAEIKLGDKAERTDVKISTGVSSVKLQVPTGVGCQIKIDGALNSKDFDGFEKIKSGLYQTEGFDKASKKIVLDVDSGLSNLEVDRY